MKIDKSFVTGNTFETVCNGQVFVVSGMVWMKMEPLGGCNAVRLTDGGHYCFGKDVIVEKVFDAVVTVVDRVKEAYKKELI